MNPPQPPVRLAGRSLGALALCVAITLLLLTGPTTGPEEWAPLALAAAGLEVTACSLGEFGFFSAAFGLWLPLGLRASPLAALGLWGALLARTLMRGWASTEGRILEGLADMFPSLVGLGVACLFRSRGYLLGAPWQGALAFLLAWFSLPGVLANSLGPGRLQTWGSTRGALGWHALALASCAVLLTMAPPRALWLALPILWAVAFSGRLAGAAADARQRQSEFADTQLKLKQQQAALEELELSQQHSTHELDLRRDTYAIIERLLNSMSSEPALQAVGRGLLDQIRIKIPCQSVALFLEEEGRLAPVAWITVHAQRIQLMSLTGDREPLVERAFQRGRLEVLGPGEGDQPGRVFVGEQRAVAVPMRDRGAFYVGDVDRGEFTPRQLDFLEALAGQAWVALEAGRYHQAQQEALSREASARAHSEGLVERLGLVLEGAASMVQLKEPQAMLDFVRQVVPRLTASCQNVWARLGAMESGGDAFPSELRVEMAQTIGQSGRPLYLDDLSQTRLGAFDPRLKSLMAVPVFAQGQVLGLVMMGSDRISAFQREDMDALAVLAYQLGASFQNAHLFAELVKAHQQLKESQAQLIHSSKLAAVGQLAGGVAHELNTPLGAIALALDGAISNLHVKPERSEQRLQRAVLSVQKMKEIVAKLLFYSRDARSERRDTDLNQVVEDTVQLLGHQFRLDDIEIETRLGTLPTIQANQNELQQVLTNLLLNSRDALLSPEASAKRIEVTTASEGDFVVLAVRDWGPGIPSEVMEHIFEPFFTTKEVGLGTGLGLSVSLQLVSGHEGTLQARSQPGQGSVFVVRLPLKGLQDEQE